MSLWSALGEVVYSVTDGVTDIVKTAIGVEDEEEDDDDQQEGGKNLFSAIGTVVAGSTDLSQAVLNASLGLTKGVTTGLQRSIVDACAANTTGEALEAALGTFTKSVTDEVVTGVKDVSKSSKAVVKGVRQGVGSLSGN